MEPITNQNQAAVAAPPERDDWRVREQIQRARADAERRMLAEAARQFGPTDGLQRLGRLALEAFSEVDRLTEATIPNLERQLATERAALAKTQAELADLAKRHRDMQGWNTDLEAHAADALEKLAFWRREGNRLRRRMVRAGVAADRARRS